MTFRIISLLIIHLCESERSEIDAIIRVKVVLNILKTQHKRRLIYPFSIRIIRRFYQSSESAWRDYSTRYNEYSHRHGKELLQVLHPDILKDVQTILKQLEPFPHGSKKGKTPKSYITEAFLERGWEKEGRADFKTDKKDLLDLCKWKVAVEMEFSRFEMFFRDFFRFMLLYERREIDVGKIITLDEMAYQKWENEDWAYKSARASLQKLIDFLR